MKQQFPGFYSNSTEAIDLRIPETAIVFDTNVLLNLYRYPVSASEDIIRLMEGLGQSVWLPYHVALEYQRNRLTVIAEQKKRFREVRATVEKGINSLEGELGRLQLVKKHSTINIAKLISDLHSTRDAFLATLSETEAAQRDVTDADPTRERLDAIFNGRIGEPPDGTWLKDVEKEGKGRFESKCPPGYCDQGKEGDLFTHQGIAYKREYGDFILWRQIITYAKIKALKQVVFVTDDDKEDWWLSIESAGQKRIGPRPELIEEIKRVANVETFVMLTSERFAPIFSKLLKIKLQANTVEQVKDVKSTLSEMVSVACPSCQRAATVKLGVAPVSSMVHFCEGCKIRFHVHRAWDSSVFTKAWGSRETTALKFPETFSPKHRVEAVCPECNALVPANIRDDESSTQRYCMTCCSLLTIDSAGGVTSSESSSPLLASHVSSQGSLTFVSCPHLSLIHI